MSDTCQPFSDMVFHSACRADWIPAGTSEFPFRQMGMTVNSMIVVSHSTSVSAHAPNG